ncbi:hypothetical protein FB471_1689 [Amycolatopsis cihanbeyliensis]|uniref:DUF5753 domain-containing protein n=2 Tax=Amycolatopsis cihanbeyliensis TaxID=1128664 RepID=A0A542DFZ0_AMYCI|nr:hypothetical protein FB471_1689 [Amycolatopsis cihanbeyliensis]
MAGRSGRLRAMVEEDSTPVIQRLTFGERARQHREAAGIEFGEADRQLGGYSGKLSKIENGIIAAKPADVEMMIQLYKLRTRQADDFRALAKDARRRSAPQRVGSSSRQYVALERAASEIRMVYNEIPGLLQTQEFAHAALSVSPMLPAGEAFGHAEARAQRSERIVHPGGPDLWIVLGMEALYREVGGSEVLRRQLERLREIADMPNVHFRVLPWSAGASPALSCPFTLLYVKPDRTLAYVESLTRPDYIKATGPHLVAFDHAYRIAAAEDESRAILEGRIVDLSQGR